MSCMYTAMTGTIRVLDHEIPSLSVTVNVTVWLLTFLKTCDVTFESVLDAIDPSFHCQKYCFITALTFVARLAVALKVTERPGSAMEGENVKSATGGLHRTPPQRILLKYASLVVSGTTVVSGAFATPCAQRAQRRSLPKAPPGTRCSWVNPWPTMLNLTFIRIPAVGGVMETLPWM